MPASIGPNHRASLKCKVDTGAGGNVMPLRTFTKLFPDRIADNGSPTGLQSTKTRLTAYNGSNIKHFGTLDTPIDWTPHEHPVANRLRT